MDLWFGYKHRICGYLLGPLVFIEYAGIDLCRIRNRAGRFCERSVSVFGANDVNRPNVLRHGVKRERQRAGIVRDNCLPKPPILPACRIECVAVGKGNAVFIRPISNAFCIHQRTIGKIQTGGLSPKLRIAWVAESTWVAIQPSFPNLLPRHSLVSKQTPFTNTGVIHGDAGD